MALKVSEIRNMGADERNQKLKELREELMHERGVHRLTPERSAPSGQTSLASLQSRRRRKSSNDGDLPRMWPAEGTLYVRGDRTRVTIRQDFGG